jgi:Helicase associated domain
MMHHEILGEMGRQNHLQRLAEAEQHRLVRPASTGPSLVGQMMRLTGVERRARRRARTELLERMFSRLGEFSSRNGHTRVPLEVESDFELGLWVFRMRGAYHRGALNQNEIDRFEAVPAWSWGAA